jgi:hypothetical protein
MWKSQRETSQFPLVYIACSEAFAKKPRIGFLYNVEESILIPFQDSRYMSCMRLVG